MLVSSFVSPSRRFFRRFASPLLVRWRFYASLRLAFAAPPSALCPARQRLALPLVSAAPQLLLRRPFRLPPCVLGVSAGLCRWSPPLRRCCFAALFAFRLVSRASARESYAFALPSRRYCRVKAMPLRCNRYPFVIAPSGSRTVRASASSASPARSAPCSTAVLPRRAPCIPCPMPAAAARRSSSGSPPSAPPVSPLVPPPQAGKTHYSLSRGILAAMPPPRAARSPRKRGVHQAPRACIQRL